MVLREFSDTFDTLLNAYNTQAMFGEQASKAEVVLDEYEKSVLLTQAQDIIVKQYFDRTLNPQGQGFDDSSRRQVDFSSLVTVGEGIRLPSVIGESNTGGADLVISIGDSKKYNIAGLIKAIRVTHKVDDSWVTDEYENEIEVYEVSPKGSYEFIIPSEDYKFDYGTDEIYQRVFNGTPKFYFNVNGGIYGGPALYLSKCGIRFTDSDQEVIETEGIVILDLEDGNPFVEIGVPSDAQPTDGVDYSGVLRVSTELDNKYEEAYDSRGILYTLPKGVLLILNEKIICQDAGGAVTGTPIENKAFTVVPINYKEYDRQMSKAFTQPLKRQAWRLFNNSDTELLKCEIIPIAGYKVSSYKLRYIRRPRPIVLVDLSNDGLEVDGQSTPQGCELNPIIHMDILNKAVELALSTRGRVSQPNNQQQQA